MKRINIYIQDRLIAQDYQRENGEWSHKWMGSDGRWERGSWRGRAEGDNSTEWRYVDITDR